MLEKRTLTRLKEMQRAHRRRRAMRGHFDVRLFNSSTFAQARIASSSMRGICGAPGKYAARESMASYWRGNIKPPLTISVPTMSAAFPFIYPNGLDPRPRPIETIVRKGSQAGETTNEVLTEASTPSFGVDERGRGEARRGRRVPACPPPGPSWLENCVQWPLIIDQRFTRRQKKVYDFSITNGLCMHEKHHSMSQSEIHSGSKIIIVSSTVGAS
jgi:hypothetical protein